MLLQVATEIPEQDIKTVVEKLVPFLVTLTPPGILLHRLVKEVMEDRPAHICETGCLRDQNPTAMMTDGWSSIYFARYVHDHPGSKLTTIEVDKTNLGYCMLTLDRFGLMDGVALTHGESVATITDMIEHPDVFYLDSCNGLEHGLAEFKAALAHHPKLIVMDDYVSKVATAAKYAAEESIPFIQMGRYTTFLTSPIAVEKFSSASFEPPSN